MSENTQTSTPPEKPALPNRDYRVARRALVVAGALFAACFVPAWSGMNMMNGGYAMIVLCGFGVICALVTAAVYGVRGRRMAALLAHGGDFIAEWVVPQPVWQQVLRKQYEEEKTMKRMLMVIVWAFCLLFGIGCPFWDPKAGFWVTAMMAGLMAITGLLVRVVPERRLRRLSAAPARVFVGQKCVLLGDELHTWALVGSWLSEVQLCQQDGLRWLRVRYSFLTRTGVQDETVLLPVPEESIPKAEQAAKALQASIKTGNAARPAG